VGLIICQTIFHPFKIVKTKIKFHKNLGNDLSSELLESVTEAPQLSNNEQLNWTELGQLLCQIPIEKGQKNKTPKVVPG
jgi:hypothetical protein